MSRYTAKIDWKRNGAHFSDSTYSRVHTWTFDSGDKITASASPGIVPEPYSSPNAVDPEEAFIASISSCHMLWFLAIASKNGFVVDRYTDQANGRMKRDGNGKLSITEVDLYPSVTYSGDHTPNNVEIQKMHDEAHEKCFIANSVKTEITVHLEDEPG